MSTARQAADEPDFISVRGAREHNLHIDELRDPQAPAGRVHRGVGLGQVIAGVRHALRRGPAPLRRVAVVLRAAVPGPDGEAQVRPDPRACRPTIAIEQKSASSNPRSTVGTVTEIYDYLRVLYARAGEQRCHQCGGEVAARSAGRDRRRAADPAAPRPRSTLLAPKAENRKGEFREVFDEARKAGFVARAHRRRGRAPRGRRRRSTRRRSTPSRSSSTASRIDHADERAPHRLGRDRAARRAAASSSAAVEGEERERAYSEERACPNCGVGLPELSPQSFSFNSPLGMCVDCNGLGSSLEVDPELVVPDPRAVHREGAIEPWGERVAQATSGWTAESSRRAGQASSGIPLDKPWKQLTAAPARGRCCTARASAA